MLKLEIVTPEKRVFDADVDFVTVPTATGEAGIMPEHASMIAALKPGILTYSIRGTKDKLAISGGFVEVNTNKVSVLADSAETAEEIDVDAARADRESAEKALNAAATSPIEENEMLREQLETAQTRVALATGK